MEIKYIEKYKNNKLQQFQSNLSLNHYSTRNNKKINVKFIFKS